MISLREIDHRVGQALRAIPTLCLTALFLLLFINVVARVFKLAGLAWFDEIVQGLFAWMVFFGAAALWREKDHFQVDWLPLALHPLWRRQLLILTDMFSIAFLGIMTWYGLQLTINATALTPILDLPVRLFYIVIPLSGAVMFVYAVADLIRLISRNAPLESNNDL